MNSWADSYTIPTTMAHINAIYDRENASAHNIQISQDPPVEKSHVLREPSSTASRLHNDGSEDLLYCAFSQKQKRWIIFIAATAGWFSTASSFIYFPAIPFLARDLEVTVQKINLTVTSYLIASGIFPFIVGNAADQYGRRPVLIVSIAVYVAVNIGLAIQRSFPTLLSLRMLQSAAISGIENPNHAHFEQFAESKGTFSFSYGVLGDITTPADRGGYVGFISILYASSMTP